MRHFWHLDSQAATAEQPESAKPGLHPLVTVGLPEPPEALDSGNAADFMFSIMSHAAESLIEPVDDGTAPLRYDSGNDFGYAGSCDDDDPAELEVETGVTTTATPGTAGCCTTHAPLPTRTPSRSRVGSAMRSPSSASGRRNISRRIMQAIVPGNGKYNQRIRRELEDLTKSTTFNNLRDQDACSIWELLLKLLVPAGTDVLSPDSECTPLISEELRGLISSNGIKLQITIGDQTDENISATLRGRHELSTVRLRAGTPMLFA